MAYTFSSLFSDARDAFTKDGNEMMKWTFLFLALPSILFELVQIFFFSFSYLPKDELKQFLLANPVLAVQFSGVSMLFAIVSLVLAIPISVYLVKNSIGLKTSVKESWTSFWMFLLCGIVVMFYLIGLSILLIIPGIIFLVYWMFGSFVLLDEKNGTKKIHESLRGSFNLVKGKWWKTLGYIILIMLLCSVVYIVVGIIYGLITVGIINIWTTGIGEIILSLISVPVTVFVILFYAKYYLALKNEKTPSVVQKAKKAIRKVVKKKSTSKKK